MGRDQQTPARRFWLLGGLSLAGYLVLRVWMPLPPYALPARRPDVATFAGWPWGALAYSALLLALFWLYWQAYRATLAAARPPRLAAILLPAALFSLLLVGAFPINALDIYNYLLLGRVDAVFDRNPYLTASAAIRQESWLVYAGEWGKGVSPYGPAFQAPANLIAWLSGDHLLTGLLLWKGLGALVMLGSALLIWLLLASNAPSRRAAHTLLWAWNPALLLTFVMNAHNDGLMIFWLLAGLLLVRRQKPVLGFAVMLLAPLTKLSGLLPIPFLLLATLRGLPDGRSRLRLLLGVTASWLLLTMVAFLPYGSPLGLLRRLLQTVTGAGYSPLALLLQTARALGQPLDREQLAGVGMVLLALAAAWLLWRTWRGRSPLAAAAEINVAYPLLSLGFRIWYAVWPFPWLVLDVPDASDDGAKSGREGWARDFRLRAGLWYLIATQLSVLIYGPLRLALLERSILWAHVLGVAFVFFLPLALAWLSLPRARGS
ncbi:MAG TPA: hypothetical protein PKL67_02155 [Anaerolineae bacterium]|nr:hypothetical protein [Anaerolineae bacterium]